MCNRSLAWTICLFVVLPFQEVCAATTSFHIGNSLTQDSQPLALEAFAQQRDLTHDSGFHIRSSSAIYEVLANPDDYNLIDDSFGTYTQALPNHTWDYVTIQPHPQFDNPDTPENEDSNLATDESGILEFINLTQSNPSNSDTTFYIYQAWPSASNLFHGEWSKGVQNNDDTRTVYRRAYFDHLINRVRDQTEADVYMIPVGEVLEELNLRLKAGALAGFSSAIPFYADPIHLDRDIGRYVASMTTFVTLLQQDPHGMVKPDGFFGQDDDFPNLYFSLIHDVIWDVVSQHPYSNVIIPNADFNNDAAVNSIDIDIFNTNFGLNSNGDSDQDGDTDGADYLNLLRNFREHLASDFNNDLSVNAGDLSTWSSSFGNNNLGDSNHDGLSNPADFLIWARQFGNSDALASSAVMVPEPCSLILLGLAFMGTCYIRKLA